MPTWLRIAFMLMAVRSDNMESTLTQIGYMALSWCLRGCFQALQRPIMIPKLVRMGKMHPEVARRTVSSKKAIAYWFTLTAAVSAFLAYHNVVRMTFFLVFTTLALPLFKAVAFPRVLPVPLFLCAVCYGVWRWEGVQELFLGLVLFQALPTAHETLRHFLGPKSGNLAGFVAWALVAAAVAPIVATFAAAYFVPEAIDWLVSNRTHASVAPYWAALEYYYSFLGFSTADGDNPYRVLGVPQTASMDAIKKRFRRLSVRYHPDKTGNDPKKKEHFVRLQQAMEVITKGTFDGAVNENALRARLRGTIARCSELTPIVGVWVALALLAFFRWVFRDRARERSEREAEAAYRAAAAARGAVPMDIPREYDIGPSFLGGNMLGYGGGNGGAARFGDAGPRAEARTVGGRRVATPQTHMPRLVELDAAAGAAGGGPAEGEGGAAQGVAVSGEGMTRRGGAKQRAGRRHR